MKRERVDDILKEYPAFYRRVWHATKTIPMGEVRSYKWVAEKAGSPKAYRAVGQALAKNPYPEIIPCHRVICSNGYIGGYSGKGGVAKKLKLIKSERDYYTIKNRHN